MPEVYKPPPNLDHISYSFLSSFTCPYQAFLRYEGKIRVKPTPWLARGNALHYALEVAHSKGRFDVKHATHLFTSEFNRIVEEEEVAIGYPQLKKMESEGIEMVIKYANKIDSGAIPAFPLVVEEEFSIPIAGTLLVGRIDKIDVIEDDEYEVTDFKSGATAPSDWSLRNNLQLTAYYWATKHIFGKYPKYVSWHHLKTGEIFRSTRTIEDIVNLQTMIANAIQVREMDIRTRIFNDLVCKYCDYAGDKYCTNKELEVEILSKR